jgi:L-aminopeptidase/D-esterase-like protein
MMQSSNARLNLITDISGLAVGNCHDEGLRSGVTVVRFAKPAVASCSVFGGAPGSRDTEALNPEMLVPGVDAIVLSGGSAFGLDAASGVQAHLREQGRGFAVGPARVPIVPGAILFDLLNGGDKAWGRYPPYRELAHEAARTAATDFSLGSAGAGFGATTISLRGGLGSASAVTTGGFTVGALAVVNALGSPVVGDGPHFWAAPWEEGTEFGGLGMPAHVSAGDRQLRWKGGLATTLAVVATDAALSKAECKRMAIVAQGGFARALRLSAAAFDGDTVFAAATGDTPRSAEPLNDLTELCAVAADCVARAIARGVYEAAPNDVPGNAPAWKQRFGR